MIGLALDKVRNIDQAQEFASDIMFEVYIAFLKHGNIANLDGYFFEDGPSLYS